jgi:hypothetical protein
VVEEEGGDVRRGLARAEGEPPEWAKKAVDWAAVDAEADKEIPADMTYELSWDSPRDEEVRLKLSASRKNPPNSASPSG